MTSPALPPRPEVSDQPAGTGRAASVALGLCIICWGIWQIPDAELGVLGDVSGLDAVELGCGTAYVSAWLARRGAASKRNFPSISASVGVR